MEVGRKIFLVSCLVTENSHIILQKQNLGIFILAALSIFFQLQMYILRSRLFPKRVIMNRCLVAF